MDKIYTGENTGIHSHLHKCGTLGLGGTNQRGLVECVRFVGSVHVFEKIGRRVADVSHLHDMACGHVYPEFTSWMPSVCIYKRARNDMLLRDTPSIKARLLVEQEAAVHVDDNRLLCVASVNGSLCWCGSEHEFR